MRTCRANRCAGCKQQSNTWYHRLHRSQAQPEQEPEHDMFNKYVRDVESLFTEISQRAAAGMRNAPSATTGDMSPQFDDLEYPALCSLFENLEFLQEHPARKAFLLDQVKALRLEQLDKQLEREGKNARHMKGMRWHQL